MRVKCFAENEKDQIVRAYQHKTLNLKELAQHFETSSRTIGRVLEERGLATPVPRLKGEAYQVMSMLKDFGIDVEGLRSLLITRDSSRMTPEVQNIMQLLKEYNMDIKGLEAVLSAPAFTPTNIQAFLNQCSTEVLARFFYTSGLVKLTEIAKSQSHATQPNSQPQPVQATPATAELQSA